MQKCVTSDVLRQVVCVCVEKESIVFAETVQRLMLDITAISHAEVKHHTA